MARKSYDIEDDIFDEEDYRRGRKFEKSARREARLNRDRDRYGFDNDNEDRDY